MRPLGFAPLTTVVLAACCAFALLPAVAASASSSVSTTVSFTVTAGSLSLALPAQDQPLGQPVVVDQRRAFTGPRWITTVVVAPATATQAETITYSVL